MIGRHDYFGFGFKTLDRKKRYPLLEVKEKVTRLISVMYENNTLGSL